jgi:hypothetical protein
MGHPSFVVVHTKPVLAEGKGGPRSIKGRPFQSRLQLL